MSALPEKEQAVIDTAKKEGDGWPLPEATDQEIIKALFDKGLVRYNERWELTPLGFSQLSWFRNAIDRFNSTSH
ncbi:MULTISPECIES: hypothetical protein [unclassified Sphingomonas]|uniref:hypothetical protein n=1 Tax=unclassified Sphingomonas TaxID=196159 RepID=UPI00226A08DD|nr:MULTISPECIES: hypothetical protein [unclassified Sphingomonas]